MGSCRSEEQHHLSAGVAIRMKSANFFDAEEERGAEALLEKVRSEAAAGP